MNKPIQIFKAGRHTAMSGVALEFTESDLQAAAQAYDPAKHEAPIVVGHPKTDAPAYGWVKSLTYADGLEAEADQIDPAFAELVAAGRFKKVSASFYTPDSPNNPVPGVYYLRHVGMLGAQPPALKGLRQAEFADTGEGVIEFGDWDDRTVARLFRSLRDWIIGRDGKEEADKVLPDWDIQSLADSAAQPEHDEAQLAPSFSETPVPKGEEMSAEDKARLAALEEENRQLKAKEADFAEKEAQRKRDADHADNVSFAETLVKEGRLVPAHKAVAVAAMDLIAAQDKPLEFGEGDDKGALTLDSVKSFLQSLPTQVDFGEHARRDGDDAAVSFAAPDGYTVDPLAMEIHARALAHQKAHAGTDYKTAVKAVLGG
ncbi:MAG: hypothetical protein LBE24_10620 [Methylobacillus sp.]|nr:hypothetical protein [Methylobacillus sp.]